MLTSLLPGLRELRAPLAAGYLWLITAWVALASRIPTTEAASGILKDIYRLGQAVGKPGVIAAVTFAAYVIGILTERMARLAARPVAYVSAKRLYLRPRLQSFPRLDRTDQVLIGAITDVLVRRYWDHPEFRDAVLQRMDPRTVNDVRRMITSALKYPDRPERISSIELPNEEPENSREPNAEADPRVKEVIVWAEQNDQKLGHLLLSLIRTEEHLVSLRDDLRRVPARLVGKEQEIYERWDRLRAESEFRLSIALPLLILSIVLAVRSSLVNLLLIIPITYLFYEGIESQTAADIQLAESMRAERITSPPLARLKSGEPLWRPLYRRDLG
jgi:hypothetical protein